MTLQGSRPASSFGTVVVTGAAGFIGSHLVERLLALGARVHGIDKLDDYYPAELKIHYDHANGDLNDDGTTDSRDSTIEQTLAIWRQENLGDPFVRLTSVLVIESDEADAELTGFSRYALAY